MSSHLVSIASSANKFMSRVAFSQNLHLCDFSRAFCSSSYCIKCRSELIVKSCTWLRSEVTQCLSFLHTLGRPFQKQSLTV